LVVASDPRGLRKLPPRLHRMLTLYGVAVTAENARHLVAALIADGGPDALAAAARIQKGVERDLYAVALKPAERDAILSVLDDPPEALADHTWSAGAGPRRPHTGALAASMPAESRPADARGFGRTGLGSVRWP
jgi:hypothetical protein